MHKNIFVNLPVKDLEKTKKFWEDLGYTFNKQFTDETAASLILGENLYAMLLTHEKIKQFTKKEIVDAHASTEVLVALDLNSKEAVDQLFEKVLKAGGKEARPTEDYGFMYGRSFEDPDGHIWEVFYMDPSYVK